MARRATKQFAAEAYAQWSAAHPAKLCPSSLTEVLEFSNSKDAKDPWGTEHRMLCGESAPASVNGGIGVQSAGAEAAFDTADDVRSW